jgi:amino acid adenylation domain-containing protein
MAGSMDRITPRAVNAPARASFAQERMWFLEELDPESAAYNQMTGFRIRGTVDAKLLERCCEAVVHRHESLRTNLWLRGSEVYQSVSAPVPLELEIVDLAAAIDGDSLKEAERRLTAAARKRFDLASDHLIRFSLMRLGADDFLLGIATHHTIFDGWSMGILINEIATLYEGRSPGQGPAGLLPAPPIQYADYAVWQRDRYDAGVYADQLRYWLDTLGTDLPALELPLDHRRPATQPFDGEAFTLVLPVDLTDRLKALGRREKTTLFMTLLAAFNVLLHRYTQQDDIVVGSPIAGRNRREIEGIIGLFVNTLALRSRISPDQSFLALLRQVRATSLEAYNNQDLPFEKLVEKLPVHRSLDRSPVFQVLFQLRNFPGRQATLAGHPVERLDFDRVMVKTDLTLEVTETPEGLVCRFEYPLALFDRGTIARMAGHWQTLLGTIVADPSVEIGKLCMLEGTERAALLACPDVGRRDYPRDGTVDGIFEARARESPDAIAIADGQARITYRELDERAGRLAGRLRSAGIEAGDPVALLMQRSAALVTAMLAILKAGGAYVPLDPGDADARIAGIVEAAGAKVLLADAGMVSRAAGLTKQAVVIDPAGQGEAPGEPPAGRTVPGPGSLAYMIFTSGSTGTPKGVSIPHRGILRLVINTDYVALAPGDVVGHLSSPAFDAATFDVWGPLLNGATVAIIDRDTALSSAALAEKIDENRINVLFLPTPLFHALAAESPSCFRRLRDLLVGGDVLQSGPASAVLREGPPGRLLNVYGPTENTTFSTWYHVKEAADGGDSIPIGRSIANSYLYILDINRQPVPVGAIGEIYLGGDGVATGYLGRPDLTAERFLPDPFRPGEGRTVYRTGDLARYLPDGNVQFIGRRDGQAKIHGHRVETGEVALALESHPAVRTAIVTVFNDPGGFRSLAAYLLRAAEATVPIGDVRHYLAGKLPAYLVPASMVWIDALPLTPGGKIDRSALPDPVIGLVQETAPGMPEVEGDHALSQMTAAWEEVLGAGRVGPDDNFFDLGGHSLLAIRLMDRIRESFGVRLPISAIFKSPTARQMLASIRETGKGRAEHILVPLQPEGARPPLYCVHGVPGTLFEFGSLAPQMGKDQPVYGLESPGCGGRVPVQDSLEAMAALYVGEIRSCQPHGPYHLIAYCAGGAFAYEVARQIAAGGERVGFLGIIDYPAPKQGPDGLFWPGYRYLMDNMGGAIVHLSGFMQAPAREKARRFLGTPRFLAKKVRAMPREVASRPGPPAANPPVHDLDWIESMPEPQRTIALRNNDVVARYVPAASDVEATIFVSSNMIRASMRAGKYEKTFGWKKLARGGVTRYVIRGDHGTIISPDGWKEIARVIRESIDGSVGDGDAHGR